MTTGCSSSAAVVRTRRWSDANTRLSFPRAMAISRNWYDWVWWIGTQSSPSCSASSLRIPEATAPAFFSIASEVDPETDRRMNVVRTGEIGSPDGRNLRLTEGRPRNNVDDLRLGCERLAEVPRRAAAR